MEAITKQEGPTWKQEGPTWKQEGPTWKQEGPTSKQEGPTSKQEGPTWKQEGPTWKSRSPTLFVRYVGLCVHGNDSLVQFLLAAGLLWLVNLLAILVSLLESKLAIFEVLTDTAVE